MVSQDEALRRAQRRVGQVLRGKWTLDRLLGVGGMAAVFAGTHRNGTRGAIKILHPELTTDSDMRSRFLQEGYAANSIGHSGVVRAIDDDDDDDTVFLVMELLEGESIEARAARQGRVLAPSEVLALADQVLDILAAAHDAGVLHRDIKPENLFLTTNGEVKLLDFGIARIGDSARHPTSTQPGSTMGTPLYMAPEQARGRWTDVDATTDLWAVGATMFSLTSGRFVHDAEMETDNEQLLAAMSHRAPSLASVAPEAPASLVEIVDRALQYEKEARWQDSRSMQNAVRLAYHGLFGKPITTAPRLRVPEEETLVMSGGGLTTGGRARQAFARTTFRDYLRERKTGAVVAAGAAGALLIGAVLVLARGSSSPTETPAASSPSSALGARPRAPDSPHFEPPRVEPPKEEVPALSLSELPPAESDTGSKRSKKPSTTMRANTPSETATATGPRRPPGLPESSPRGATKPPAPTEQKDVLDQQW